MWYFIVPITDLCTLLTLAESRSRSRLNKRYSDFSGVSFFQDWGQFRLKVSSTTIRMSNSLDLDDNQQFASLIRVLNCLQTSVISKTSMQRIQKISSARKYILVHDLNKFYKTFYIRKSSLGKAPHKEFT